MRFMMIVKASEDSEAGVMPSEAELREMGAYNEKLVDAGILLAGDGLRPSRDGYRVNFDGDKPVVIDGPFTETKELIAGYWILDVGSAAEAIEWAKRIPFREGEVEIRPFFETEDFAESDPTGELRAAEHELRRRSENRG